MGKSGVESEFWDMVCIRGADERWPWFGTKPMWNGYAAGGMSQEALAIELRVSQATIHRIVSGKSHASIGRRQAHQ